MFTVTRVFTLHTEIYSTIGVQFDYRIPAGWVIHNKQGGRETALFIICG